MVWSSSYEADNEQFTKWAAQRFQTAENWTRSKQAYLIIFLYSPNFQSLELWNECLRPFPHLDIEAQTTRHRESGLFVGYVCGALTMQFLTWRGRKAHFLHACIQWIRYRDTYTPARDTFQLPEPQRNKILLLQQSGHTNRIMMNWAIILTSTADTNHLRV